MRLAEMTAPLIYSSTNKVYGEMTDLGVVEKNGRYAYRSLDFGVPEDRNLDFHSPYGCSTSDCDQSERKESQGEKSPEMFLQAVFGRSAPGETNSGWVLSVLK